MSTGAFQAAFLTSVTRAGAALATVVALGVAPPVAGLIARVATGERLTSAWVLGTVAAVAGSALLLLSGAGGAVDPLGILHGLVTGTCYGLYTVSAKKLLESGAPTYAVIAATLLVGALILSPSLASDPAAMLAPRTLALVGWLAVPATALAYVLFVAGLANVRLAVSLSPRS